MGSYSFKIISSIFILIYNLIFIYTSKYFQSSPFIEGIKSFSSGVFITVGICNLFPESIRLLPYCRFPIPVIVAVLSDILTAAISKATKSFGVSDYSDESSSKNSQIKPIRVITLGNYFGILFYNLVNGITFGLVEDSSCLWGLLISFIAMSLKFIDHMALLSTANNFLIFIISLAAPLTAIILTVCDINEPLYAGIATAFSTGIFLYSAFIEFFDFVKKAKQFSNQSKLFHVSLFLSGMMFILILPMT